MQLVLEVKRISADRRRDSVRLPVTGSAHVRVGRAGPPDCQVPLRRTRLTAGFLRLVEKSLFRLNFFKVSSILHARNVRIAIFIHHLKTPFNMRNLYLFRCKFTVTVYINFSKLVIGSC